jgi:gliding motility-associated-like protein
VRNIHYECPSASYPFSIFIVPNIITPNGDGINDVWNLNGLELFPETKIQIFNRYGKLLIDKTFTKNPIWDGKCQGKPVGSDNYWYIIEFPDGKKLTGWLVVRNYDNNYR